MGARSGGGAGWGRCGDGVFNHQHRRVIDLFAALKVAQVIRFADWALQSHTMIAGGVAVPVSGVR